MLNGVYVLTPEEREHRDLLRTRRQIVDHRNDVARQIKSKLLFYGITPPFRASRPWNLKIYHVAQDAPVRYNVPQGMPRPSH